MQKKIIVLAVAAAIPALLITPSVWAAADSITGALTSGKTSANVQYRYEDVATGAATANKGTAHTVRLRLGYTTDTYNGFGAMVEAESVKSLNKKQAKGYNSTTNGNTTRAIVPDPEITEINQAYLSYGGVADTTVKYGRQRLILDNARFIGNVGWRQNEQTFDAFTLVNKSLPDTEFTLGQIFNVNRVFGDGSVQGNNKMNSTVVNANYKGLGFGAISAYYYKLDYDKNAVVVIPAGPIPATGQSSNSIGVRLNGSTAMATNKLLYTAEFATQKGAGTNPVKYSAKYVFVEGGLDMTDVAVFKLGYEVLGADSTNLGSSFQTPLATLHAFNGWADRFLVTPGQGLKDTYLSVGGKAAGVNLLGVYHTYKADRTTATLSSYGKELNLLAAYPIDKNYAVGVKYAKFTADTAFGATNDLKKTWLWGEFKF